MQDGGIANGVGQTDGLVEGVVRDVWRLVFTGESDGAGGLQREMEYGMGASPATVQMRVDGVKGETRGADRTARELQTRAFWGGRERFSDGAAGRCGCGRGWDGRGGGRHELCVGTDQNG